MIGIIGAMDVEVESIKALLTDTHTENISGVSFVKGQFAGKEIVVAKCGVGKVFSALCTEAMILKFSPEMIINVGVAGCLTPDLKIGDAVIADNVCQHDVGMLSDINIVKIPTDQKVTALLADAVAEAEVSYKIGTIASGDQFVASSEKKEYIKSNFSAISCEMEGGSIGHVCFVNNVPFAVLRTMSDGADDGANMDFPTFCKMAAENEVKIIEKFLLKA